MRTVITKCYLVQITDNEGNELACSYVFGDKEEAKREGRSLKEGLEKEKREQRAREGAVE